MNLLFHPAQTVAHSIKVEISSILAKGIKNSLIPKIGGEGHYLLFSSTGRL